MLAVQCFQKEQRCIGYRDEIYALVMENGQMPPYAKVYTYTEGHYVSYKLYILYLSLLAILGHPSKVAQILWRLVGNV